MAVPKNDTVNPTRRTLTIRIAALAFVVLTTGAVLGGCASTETPADLTQQAAAAARPTAEPTSVGLVADGKQVFRFDTMGNEQLWTDKLRLHEVVEKNVDPTTALKIGLKVCGRAASRDPRKSRS